MNRERTLLEPQPDLGGAVLERPPMPTPSAPPPIGPGPELPSVEDAGTQALSEALASSFRIVKLLMAGLVIVFLASGIFTVKPNEVAVKLRFGRPVGTGSERLLKPGLHWAFPSPIDEIVRVPAGQSHSVMSSVGWYAITPQQEALGQLPEARASMVPGADGYTLTADGNIIHVRASLKYRITDPFAYAFNYVSFSNILQNVVNEAILFASARFKADAALYKDKDGFKEAVLARVRDMIERHQLGIALEPSDVETAAPIYVKEAFEEVLKAENDRSKKINDAQGEADITLGKARGEAEGIRSAGHSASNQVVQAVSAEARSFLDQLPYFEKDPELFRSRLLADRLSRILTNATEVFYIPEARLGTEREIRIQMNPPPARRPPPPSR
jgi:membrane protease subunit HflK